MMGVPKKILTLYQDGVEIKTALTSVYKGKIKIEALDQATLITPFQQLQDDIEDLPQDIGALETAENAFGIDDKPASIHDNPDLTDEAEQVPEPEQGFGSMDQASEDDQYEEEETNEDILLNLMSRVPAKRYAHAINLPRSLVHTLHLRSNYTQLKPRERKKQVFNEIIERQNDVELPKDHYDCFFTESGEAYAFVYKDDIPLIKAFDDIQTFLKVKPRFVSVCTDEVALINLLRFNYDDIGSEEIIALVNIEDVQSSFIITQGYNVIHFSQSIRENLKSPSLLNAISGKMLYDQDLGHYQDIARIILTGEARQIDAKTFFEQANDDAKVEYLSLNPDKFIIPEQDNAAYTDYAIPLGLAVQVLFPKKEETLLINLLPDYVIRRQKTFKLAWHGMLLLFLIFLVPFVINWLYEQKNTSHRDALQKITHLEQSINDVEWVTYMVDSLSLAHSVAQEKLTTLTELSKGSLRWSVTLRHLFTAMEEVDGLWISELKSKGEGIELAGYSLYRNRIPSFIEYFEDAEIKSVVPDDIRGKTVYQFLISINRISSDSLAFDPKIIIPPHQAEANPESSSPIIIIDEEQVISALDTLNTDSLGMMPDSGKGMVADSLLSTTILDTLAEDSLGVSDLMDTLQITTPDSAGSVDSLDYYEADTTELVLQDTVMLDSDEEAAAELEVPEFALKVYKVENDESLRSIAETLLGSADRWSEIYNLNLDILSDPLSLEPGQTLIVLLDEPDLESITHIVQGGENLKLLARRYYGDASRWEKIYQLNKTALANPNRIFPGQKLTIIKAEQRYQFPMQIHTIRPGESLKRIARRYLGDEERWEEIYKLNQDVIKYANIIYAGQRIRVMNETGAKNASRE